MNTRLSSTSHPSWVAFLGLIILTLALAGCAGSSASGPSTQAPPAPTAAQPAPTELPPAPTDVPPAPTAEAAGATVALAKNDALGTFLADDEGMTLYLFTKDTPNTSNCYEQCEQAWPPLFTEGAPVAGEGVDAALLGTTTRKDGSIQVTYNGWPLYYFAKDQKPGDVTGQNVGDVWFVISPEGDMIKAAESPGASAPIASDTVTINVQNFAFNPQDLTIPAGTTVIWHNSDSATHTVTSDTGLFDGSLASGADFQFTFIQPGTYPYYCKPHGGMGGQGMSGVITVS